MTFVRLFWATVVAAGLLGMLMGCTRENSDAARRAPQPRAQLEPGPTTGSAVIVARVKFLGQPPVMPAIRVGGDPYCVEKYKDSPLLREDVVVNPDGTLRDVVIRIKSGLPERDWSAFGMEPFVINQDGCRFEPHVGSMMASQPLEFRNGDRTIHNVNGQPRVNSKFNFSMINEHVPPRQITFAKAEWPPVRIKCDVHPWMYAFVAVLDHPFHGTTGTSGTVEIRRVPAGTYLVEAWHRELGTQEKEVTVADGQLVNLEFQFEVK
jgi:hypothetical protein